MDTQCLQDVEAGWIEIAGIYGGNPEALDDPEFRMAVEAVDAAAKSGDVEWVRCAVSAAISAMKVACVRRPARLDIAAFCVKSPRYGIVWFGEKEDCPEGATRFSFGEIDVLRRFARNPGPLVALRRSIPDCEILELRQH